MTTARFGHGSFSRIFCNVVEDDEDTDDDDDDDDDDSGAAGVEGALPGDDGSADSGAIPSAATVTTLS